MVHQIAARSTVWFVHTLCASKVMLRTRKGLDMTKTFLVLSIAMNLIYFIGCKEESTTSTTPSNVFHAQENSTNHLKLDISSIDSRLVYNDTLNFTSDSILVSLRIVGMKERAGTGDIHLYSDHGISHEGTTFAAYPIVRDTLIRDTLVTDTLIYKAPDWITITFLNFTGNVIYQMDSL